MYSLSSYLQADSSDPRELQRRLRDALNEVEDYKTRLEKANKVYIIIFCANIEPYSLSFVEIPSLVHTQK